jgi:uncharacterized protein (DUF305 family)
MLELVRRLAVPVVCVLGLMLATLGSAHDHPAAAPGSPSPFYGEMAEADATMHRDMTVAPSGDLDRDFLRMMVPHHQGAIDMALLVLKYGRDERVKRLAQSIVVQQGEEITYMRTLLDGPPATK